MENTCSAEDMKDFQGCKEVACFVPIMFFAAAAKGKFKVTDKLFVIL